MTETYSKITYTLSSRPRPLDPQLVTMATTPTNHLDYVYTRLAPLGDWWQRMEASAATFHKLLDTGELDVVPGPDDLTYFGLTSPRSGSLGDASWREEYRELPLLFAVNGTPVAIRVIETERGLRLETLEPQELGENEHFVYKSNGTFIDDTENVEKYIPVYEQTMTGIVFVENAGASDAFLREQQITYGTRL